MFLCRPHRAERALSLEVVWWSHLLDCLKFEIPVVWYGQCNARRFIKTRLHLPIGHIIKTHQQEQAWFSSLFSHNNFNSPPS